MARSRRGGVLACLPSPVPVLVNKLEISAQPVCSEYCQLERKWVRGRDNQLKVIEMIHQGSAYFCSKPELAPCWSSIPGTPLVRNAMSVFPILQKGGGLSGQVSGGHSNLLFVWLAECPPVRALNRIQRILLCPPGSLSASTQDPRLSSLRPSEVEAEEQDGDTSIQMTISSTCPRAHTSCLRAGTQPRNKCSFPTMK